MTLQLVEIAGSRGGHRLSSVSTAPTLWSCSSPYLFSALGCPGTASFL